MTIRDRDSILAEAGRRLDHAAYAPGKLVLLHSGITFGVALLIALLNHLLIWQVDTQTGGLAGMGLRSILETAASFLGTAQNIALPFWSIGLTYAVLRIARGEQAGPKSLLEGFRRFGPVLRLRLLEMLLYSIVCTFCCYAGVLLFLLTPLASSAAQLMEPMLYAETTAQIDAAMAVLESPEFLSSMMPAIVICFGLSFLAILPLVYRFRMADFVIMDVPGTGALAALVTSSRMMKKNCLQLLRLDLRFWWYYLLTALAALLGYGDVLLQQLPIQLPVSNTVLFFGAYVLYALASLCLHRWMLHRVQTAYAVAYDVLRSTPAAPRQLPWDEPEQKEE